MSGAWTPGPWMINPKASTNVEAGRRGVAACGGYYDNTSDGAYAVENDANAYLIAAAPDLYAALEVCAEWIVDLAACGDAGFWDGEEMPQIIAARAAMAKARGGA